MRLGVLSDTHGKKEFIHKALEQMGKVDLLIHAGDYYRDAAAIEKETGIKVIGVTGNCDLNSTGSKEEELELYGYRIFITHGHLFGVKTDNSMLIKKLKDEKYDLIIYGHSHVPEIIRLKEGWLLNPGSLSDPRMGTPRSFGIVEVDKNGIIPYIYELKW